MSKIFIKIYLLRAKRRNFIVNVTAKEYFQKNTEQLWAAYSSNKLIQLKIQAFTNIFKNFKMGKKDEQKKLKKMIQVERRFLQLVLAIFSFFFLNNSNSKKKKKKHKYAACLNCSDL